MSSISVQDSTSVDCTGRLGCCFEKIQPDVSATGSNDGSHRIRVPTP